MTSTYKIQNLNHASKNPIIGCVLLVLALISTLVGQIWIPVIIVPLGVGFLLNHWVFKKSKLSSLQSPVSPTEISKDKHPQSEISFWNLPLSRIVVIVVVFILAVIDAGLFRTPLVDRYNPIGSWQILMGPTLFYPMVFLPLLLSIGLLFNLIFTIRRIRIIKKGDALLIQERGLLRLENQIDLAKVSNNQFRSNKTGLKVLWIIPWGIQIWGNFASAWHYFTNEFTFGTGLFIGPTYFIHAIIYFMLLGVLLFSPEYEYHWETSTQDCYLRWYHFHFLKTFSQEQLECFLKLGEFDTAEKKISAENDKEHNNIKYYLVLGLFQLLFPIVSIAFSFFLSDIPRIIIFMGGIASLAIVLKDHPQPFSKRYPFRYVLYGQKTQDSHHTPLEIFVFLSQLVQILVITVILTIKWHIYPYVAGTSFSLWLDLLVSSVIGGSLIWLYIKKQWDINREKNPLFKTLAYSFIGLGIVFAFIF